MRCSNCKEEMIKEFGSHQYKESGLDNVFLDGVLIYKCSCGEKMIGIPHMPELHNLIGLSLLKKKSLLDGKEIRFLRKNMGLTGIRLAKLLGVDNATISRWEKGKHPITNAHDRTLRLVYSIIKGIETEKIRHLLEDEFVEIKPSLIPSPVHKIPLDQWPNKGHVLFPQLAAQNS
jgi:putative zinc finger/helix-turn-helix YgiT family protein